MGTRWCFLCENPKSSQRSGWLWFHDECALRLMTNSGDLIFIIEGIKSGKFKTLDDVKTYLKESMDFDEKQQFSSRYFNALRKNTNKGVRPVL